MASDERVEAAVILAAHQPTGGATGIDGGWNRECSCGAEVATLWDRDGDNWDLPFARHQAAAAGVDDLEAENARLSAGWARAFDLGVVHQARADALEAENARLREALHLGVELDNHHNAAMCPYCRPGDDARRELDGLRVGVEALADEWADAFITGRAAAVPLHERVAALRALLAAAPSEPAAEEFAEIDTAPAEFDQMWNQAADNAVTIMHALPTTGPVVVSAERYDDATNDASVKGYAEDAGCDPTDILDVAISALGITVTEEDHHA